MVLHFFECKKGHIFEKEVESTYPIPKQRCPECKSLAERVFLSQYQKRLAATFQPSTMFVNSEGHVVNFGRAGTDHISKKELAALHAQGYKEQTISTFQQYESFCRTQNQIMKEKYDAKSYADRQAYEHAMKENFRQLQSGFTMTLPDENGNLKETRIPPLSEMHPMIQKVVHQAMEKYSNETPENYNPGCHITAFEYDNAYYSDRDTDWKRRY